MKEWQKTKVQNLVKRASGLYYAQVTFYGKQYRRSLETKKLEIARMKLPAMLKSIREIDKTIETDNLGKSMDIWWDRKQVDAEMRPETITYYETMRKFVNKELSREKQVSDAQAVLWWRDSVRGVVSSNYANNILGMMRGVMDVEVKAGVRSNNPFTSIKKLKIEVPDLVLPSKKEFNKVVKHIKKVKHWSAKQSADLVQWLAYSGMRIGEVNALLWNDVKADEIVVRGKQIDSKSNRAGTKSGKIRRVPINSNLAKVIKRRKKAKINDLVFQIKSPKKALKAACEAVGCNHMSPHKLRHLFATVCIEAGVDIPTVAKWLGHQDGGALAMKVYGHLRDEHSQQQMKSVEF